MISGAIAPFTAQVEIVVLDSGAWGVFTALIELPYAFISLQMGRELRVRKLRQPMKPDGTSVSMRSENHEKTI